MFIPIPGTATNSASFRGQVAAIPRSARSPKTRNAGIFLCLASLSRLARKACSIRICGSGSRTAAPVLAGPDCVRAVALGRIGFCTKITYGINLERYSGYPLTARPFPLGSCPGPPIPRMPSDCDGATGDCVAQLSLCSYGLQVPGRFADPLRALRAD